MAVLRIIGTTQHSPGLNRAGQGKEGNCVDGDGHEACVMWACGRRRTPIHRPDRNNNVIRKQLFNRRARNNNLQIASSPLVRLYYLIHQVPYKVLRNNSGGEIKESISYRRGDRSVELSMSVDNCLVGSRMEVRSAIRTKLGRMVNTYNEDSIDFLEYLDPPLTKSCVLILDQVWCRSNMLALGNGRIC